MNHKIKSTLIISFVLVMMFSVALVINLNEGITGAVVSEKVSCYVNSDCNDKIENTEDICRNPGTVDSFCVNRPKDNFE